MRYLVVFTVLLFGTNLHAQTGSIRELFDACGAAFKKGMTKETFDICKESADKGELFSKGVVGNLYQEGKVVPKDLQKANNYLSEAAKAGMPNAQFNLARLFLENATTSDEYILGMHYWRLFKRTKSYSEYENKGLLKTLDQSFQQKVVQHIFKQNIQEGLKLAYPVAYMDYPIVQLNLSSFLFILSKQGDSAVHKRAKAESYAWLTIFASNPEAEPNKERLKELLDEFSDEEKVVGEALRKNEMEPNLASMKQKLAATEKGYVYNGPSDVH